MGDAGYLVAFNTPSLEEAWNTLADIAELLLKDDPGGDFQTLFPLPVDCGGWVAVIWVQSRRGRRAVRRYFAIHDWAFQWDDLPSVLGGTSPRG